MFDSILNLGIDQRSNASQIKQLRIVNGVAFIGGTVLVITSIVLYFLFEPFQRVNLSLMNDFLFGQGEAKELARYNFRIIFPIIDFSVGVTCLLILLLNAKKLVAIAKGVLCALATLFSSFLFLIGGIKIVFIFFIPAILPVMFFKKRSVYFTIAFLNFAILIIIAYILNQKNSFIYVPQADYFSTFFVNIFFAFIVIILMVKHFKDQNVINEEMLEKQNEDLKVLSNEISKQRDELREKNTKLKLMNLTKDKFFSIIAHDLRNPFNSIIGFSGLLVRSLEKNGKGESYDYANIINTSAKQAHSLLENLLEWSRSQTGVLKFNPRIVNLHKVVSQNITICSSLAEAKEIIISHDISDDLTIQADENMLNTIFRNLITNAIKYSHKGGEIHISATLNDSIITISVIDYGIGMSNETLEKIFNLNLDSSVLGTENEKGTGLGLFLCKEFVKKHKGTICAESELGKGSKFKFTLPLNI